MREEPILIGPHRLTVDPVKAQAYAREIGHDGVSVPVAYPSVWLTEPSVYDPVRALCAQLDVVPVHESQRFDFVRPLVAGESYDLNASLRREPKPPRLILEATLTATDGAPVGRIETMLRLVSRKALEAGGDGA
jgi:hypothetical protein